jgi:hypothetical protein
MHFVSRLIGGAALAAALLAASAGSGRAEQVVLSDPLSAWPLNFGAQSDIIMLKDGAVHIVEPGNNASWETYPGFSFTDMDASITITPETPNGYAGGLVFWASAQSMYVFYVADTEGTFCIYHFFPGASNAWQTVVPWTANAGIKKGAANTLRVVTKGNSVTLYVNGTSIGTLAVMAPAGGGTVGFIGSGTGKGSTDYAFSNLSVSD